MVKINRRKFIYSTAMITGIPALIATYGGEATAVHLRKAGLIKKAVPILIGRPFRVVPPGIEPGTHGFSVHCSTD